MEADEVSIREQNFHSQVREYTVRAVTLGPSPSQPFTGAAFLAAALPSGPARPCRGQRGGRAAARVAPCPALRSASRFSGCLPVLPAKRGSAVCKCGCIYVCTQLYV